MSSVIGESIMKYSYKIVLIIQCPVIGISCVFFLRKSCCFGSHSFRKCRSRLTFTDHFLLLY